MALRALCMLAAFAIVAEAAWSQETTRPGWMEWGPSYYASKPVRGGVLRVASPVYVGLMNPHHFPVLDWITMSYVYEKLINLDARHKPTVPWLAVSWEFENDLTVLMRLRKDVRFHDGTSFNAQALKYQMDWIMDRDNLAWTRAWIEPLKAVEVVDEFTVRWRFKRPWGSFLGTMASVPGYMVSARALERDAARIKAKRLERELITARRKAQNERDPKRSAQAAQAIAAMEEHHRRYQALAREGKSLDIHPVGTGPFVFESASTDNYVQLKRNPAWWFGSSMGMPDMPYFNGIRVSVIPDPSVRLANLKAGTLDFIVADAVQYRMVKNDPNLNVVTFPVNWLVYLAFNTARGPCADIRVRKAISHAIDRTALVMGTQFGLGRVSSCLYPDDHWAHNPDLKPVKYDPELSRRLLREAGYPGGLTIRGFTHTAPEAQAFAKAVMAMLDKVGITWRPVFLGVTAMMEPYRRLDFDMLGMLYPWIQEPDHIATLLYDPESPFNNGRSRNEKAIALIRQGRQSTDEAKRARIYQDLERALYENYEDAWLWWPTAVLASSRRLEGYNHEMSMKYGEAYHFSHPQWFRDGRP
jgi:peptide/nickel transport system substrate-binding protein